MEHLPKNTDATVALNTEFDSKNIIKTNIPHILNDVNQRLNFTIEYDDVFILDNMFTQTECENLIDFASKHGYGQTGFVPGYRGYLRLLTDDNMLAKNIWTRIKDHVPESVIDEHGSKWIADGLNVRFRWTMYPIGTHFVRHCDFFHKDGPNRKSFYTVNMYLNNSFGNGRTRFYENDITDTKPFYQVDPIPGRALIFIQPDKKYLIHDGETVTDNEKYLLRSDVMYKRLT